MTARAVLAVAGDDSMRSLVDFSRSNVFAELNRPAEALALLEEVIAAFDGSGQGVQAAQARSHMAYLQFLRGNYNTALAVYYEARDRLAELGSTQLVAYCNLDIAEVLLALNSFEDAEESAALARSSFDELGMAYDAARAALAQALSSMGAGRLDKAEDDLKAARAVFAESGNRVFTELADCYLAELALRGKRVEEARELAASSLRVFSRHRLLARSAYCRLIVARAAYETGNAGKAAREAGRALKLVEGLFAPSVVYKCHHLIGRIERDRNRKALALDSLRLAVEGIEKLRGAVAADEFRATFLRDKIEVYEDAIAACLDDGSAELVEEAFTLGSHKRSARGERTSAHQI